MGTFISSDVPVSNATPLNDVDSHVGNRRNGKRLGRVWQFVRHEPMLHFLFAGALIFSATHFISEYRDRSAHTIVVDAPLRDRLTKLYALQLGSTPTDAQLTQLIDSYVHDEILYREALALGLDKGDEIVRRRLVQKMGFLQSDLVIANDPDEAVLRSYYSQHAGEFAPPARVDFQQRYFGDDAAASGENRRRAVAALARLNGDSGAADRGAARSPVAGQYRQLDRDGLTRLFGATPVVDELLQAPVGVWLGPFQSGYGWHLIRVDARAESHTPTFDSVRDAVVEAVRARQKEDNNRASFGQLRARYDVQIDAPAVAP